MTIAHSVLSSHFVISPSWRDDWVWGVPIIVVTVIIHVFSLGLMNHRGDRRLSYMTERRYPMLGFAQVMGATTLLAILLHAVEAGIWALSYRFLGALPDFKTSMLYSLNAITSYGHESLVLESHWQLMGAIEALNGWLLFGLTTAFLFGMIQKLWMLERNGTQKLKSDQPLINHSSRHFPAADRS